MFDRDNWRAAVTPGATSCRQLKARVARLLNRHRGSGHALQPTAECHQAERSAEPAGTGQGGWIHR